MNLSDERLAVDSWSLLCIFGSMDSESPNIISQTLENEIISGELLPGVLLQQEELAKRFGVSRQPIRAALDILTAKGLASRRPNRTVEVGGLHPGAAEDTLAVRKLLEPEALLASIDDLTPHDLLAAKQAQERFEIETDANCLAQHDTDFHLALYARCGNRVLLDLIADLRLMNRRAYLGQTLGSRTRDLCIHSHWQLLEAVTEKETDRAIMLLQDHFDHTKDREK